MLANEFWFIKIWMQKCKNLSAHWPFICTSYAHLIQNHKSNTTHDSLFNLNLELSASKWTQIKTLHLREINTQAWESSMNNSSISVEGLPKCRSDLLLTVLTSADHLHHSLEYLLEITLKNRKTKHNLLRFMIGRRLRFTDLCQGMKLIRPV